MSSTRYPTFTVRQYPDFEPRNTLGLTLRAAVFSAGAGVFVAAIKNSLGTERSVLGGFKTSGKYVALYGAVGTAFTLVEAVATNLRGKESAWNTFLGGAAAGGIMGATFKSVPKVFGGAFLVGTILGLSEWSGGAFTGLQRDESFVKATGQVVEPETRQGFWEVVHRRPLSQTVDELGDLVKPFK